MKIIELIKVCHLVATSDVAMLFGYQTKDSNRAVKNNINRFPENYCFRLNEEEYKNLRCNFFTSNSSSNYGGRSFLPYVFTKHGFIILSGLLKSDIATNVLIFVLNKCKKISNRLVRKLKISSFEIINTTNKCHI